MVKKAFACLSTQRNLSTGVEPSFCSCTRCWIDHIWIDHIIRTKFRLDGVFFPPRAKEIARGHRFTVIRGKGLRFSKQMLHISNEVTEIVEADAITMFIRHLNMYFNGNITEDLGQMHANGISLAGHHGQHGQERDFRVCFCAVFIYNLTIMS